MIQSRIPADAEYLAALGRAFYNFTYLEWQIISVIGKLDAGYVSSLRGARKTAGDVCKDLGTRTEAHKGSLSPDALTALRKLKTAFNEALRIRNRLLHAHPYTADDGGQRLMARDLPWTIDEVAKAVQLFEDVAIQGNDVYYKRIT